MTTATAPRGAAAAWTTAWRPATAGLAGAAVIIAFGNLHVAKGEHGGVGPALGTSVFCLIVAAALFGFGVPRWSGSARATTVLGVLAVLSVLAFWSGVVAVLAAATVAVAPRGAAAGRAVRILVVLAVLAAVLAGGWTVATFLA